MSHLLISGLLISRLLVDHHTLGLLCVDNINSFPKHSVRFKTLVIVEGEAGVDDGYGQVSQYWDPGLNTNYLLVLNSWTVKAKSISICHYVNNVG